MDDKKVISEVQKLNYFATLNLHFINQKCRNKARENTHRCTGPNESQITFYQPKHHTENIGNLVSMNVHVTLRL